MPERSFLLVLGAARSACSTWRTMDRYQPILLPNWLQHWTSLRSLLRVDAFAPFSETSFAAISMFRRANTLILIMMMCLSPRGQDGKFEFTQEDSLEDDDTVRTLLCLPHPCCSSLSFVSCVLVRPCCCGCGVVCRGVA